MNKIKIFLNGIFQKRRHFKSIRFPILFNMALKNFADKKLRSFLTVFGVVIGVGAVFFLLSFGLGIQSIVTEQVVGDRSLKVIDVVSPNSKVVKLDEKTVNMIGRFPNIEKVGVQYLSSGVMSFEGSEVDVITYGINQQYQSLSTLNISKGRLLDEKDSRSVVLNISALKAVGIDDIDSAVNQQVRLFIPLDRAEAKEKSISDNFTIVGVIDSGSSSEIFMPSGIFDVAGVTGYNQVKVVVNDLSKVSNARLQIESIGFQTTSLVDTLTEIDNIFKFFNMILIGFGSIGMVVAILGMFNTLTISLLERTKEIGLMIALGARRSDMRKLFIFEAGIISFVGAISGIVLAIISGKVVDFYVNYRASGRGVTEKFDLFSTPLWAIGLIILVTILIGILVVYIPAKRAERINPIDALRRE